jgi:hypothetical protein
LAAGTPVPAPGAPAWVVRPAWEAALRERLEWAAVPRERAVPDSEVRPDWAVAWPDVVRSVVMKAGRHTRSRPANEDTIVSPAEVDSEVIAPAAVGLGAADLGAADLGAATSAAAGLAAVDLVAVDLVAAGLAAAGADASCHCVDFR